jgi:hypothetical protein
MLAAALAAADRTYDNQSEDMASSTVVASKRFKRLIAAKRTGMKLAVEELRHQVLRHRSKVVIGRAALVGPRGRLAFWRSWAIRR